MISDGSGWAVPSGYMASGSLTIGSVNANYGGGNLWNSSTAGLLLETISNTEIAVHDSGKRAASLIYYEGEDVNRITIGRDMGWGSISSLSVKAGLLDVSGSLKIGSIQLSNFTGKDQDEWPNVVWYRDTANGWDEGLIKHSSAKGKFGRTGFGIHFDKSKEFGFWSSGWDPLFAVEGGTGNTFIKGKVQTGSLDVQGNASFVGNISFGAQIRQMLNLWNTAYGIGVQNATMYFRADNNFAWYRGGSHHSDALNAGGGKMVMAIQGDDVTINGQLVVNSPSGNRLIMQGDGNLVIYRSNGAVGFHTNTQVSDSRLKKDILAIDNPVEKLLSVNGITFNWTEEEWGTDREYGVLADEVEKVFPELVHSIDKKYKSVKYQGLIPVLIEAVKEQQATIQRLDEAIKTINARLKLKPA